MRNYWRGPERANGGANLRGKGNNATWLTSEVVTKTPSIKAEIAASG